MSTYDDVVARITATPEEQTLLDQIVASADLPHPLAHMTDVDVAFVNTVNTMRNLVRVVGLERARDLVADLIAMDQLIALSFMEEPHEPTAPLPGGTDLPGEL